MMQTERRGWIGQEAQQLALLSLAVLSWLLAEKGAHGNGFIAAFIAGGILRLRYEQSGKHMSSFNQDWGYLLVFLIFSAFGLVAAPGLNDITGSLWLYGLLSLTVVRLVPVAVSMIGSRLQPVSVLFLGWFGPRGLASVVLGMIYLQNQTTIAPNSNIALAMIATVLLRILLHGVSAIPCIRLHARALRADVPEYAEAKST